MLNNDRDDEPKTEKESDENEIEYQFSEDEMYEITPEEETQKNTEEPKVSATKPGLFKKPFSFKKMIISVFVLVILSYIAYKILLPTPTATFNGPVVTAGQPAGQTPVVAPPQAMQNVLPIQSPIAPTAPPKEEPQGVAANQTPKTPLETVSDRLNSNEKAIAQLAADYTQKINDFSQQNRMLQDQMQTLNTRISTLESQLNQLTQAILSQAASHTNNTNAAANPINEAVNQPVEGENHTTKTNYSVQAIIPGRAWLRAGDGETLTVAEGDNIKGLGRVTRIDPYDGIVEVSVGNKTVTISYGNT